MLGKQLPKVEQMLRDAHDDHLAFLRPGTRARHPFGCRDPTALTTLLDSAGCVLRTCHEPQLPDTHMSRRD